MIKNPNIVYHGSFEVKKFRGFHTFACPRNFFIWKFKMVLFKQGFKRKYEGFSEHFFVKVCMYNLPQNFSTLKLSCIVYGKCPTGCLRKETYVGNSTFPILHREISSGCEGVGFQLGALGLQKFASKECWNPQVFLPPSPSYAIDTW